MSNLIITQAAKLGESFGMEGDGHELLQILKSTAFKGQVTDAQMAALMVVANQYQLNPFTRELFAFPDKNNGIVPVVGVDGWSRIINSHPQFDGIEFEQDADSCTCIIYRKDRNRPIKVTEYMDECKRGTGPWQSHPRRMLRHKAMIQGARLAFGYGGIYDQDEAERIVDASPTEKYMGPAEVVTPTGPAAYSDEEFQQHLPKWSDVIRGGRKTADQMIAFIGSKRPLTEQQQAALRAVQKSTDVPEAATHEDAPAMSYAEVADRLCKAANTDELATAGSMISLVQDEQQRQELVAMYDQCANAL